MKELLSHLILPPGSTHQVALRYEPGTVEREQEPFDFPSPGLYQQSGHKRGILQRKHTNTLTNSQPWSFAITTVLDSQPTIAKRTDIRLARSRTE